MQMQSKPIEQRNHFAVSVKCDLSDVDFYIEENDRYDILNAPPLCRKCNHSYIPVRDKGIFIHPKEVIYAE